MMVVGTGKSTLVLVAHAEISEWPKTDEQAGARPSPGSPKRKTGGHPGI